MAQIEVRFPEGADLPPPEGVNYFDFSFLGPEVQLLAGYMDLKSLAIASQSADDEVNVLSPEITHRLVMSIRGFLHLRAQIDGILGKMVEGGILDEEAIDSFDE